jgi:phage tail sheath protein FI
VVTITNVLGPDDTTVVASKFSAAFGAAPAAPNKYNMYYALQMFFANGGGPCYIVSVGDTTGAGPDAGKIKDGLMQLRAADEPTIIVIPGATYLTEANYFDVYNTALQQCADLKDRIALIDVRQTAGATVVDDITKNFRQDSGGLVVDNLLYGAAYYPYLNTTVDFDFSGVEDKIKVATKNVKSDGTEEDGGEVMLDSLRATDNLKYEQCKQALNNLPMVMPPSPAMAGVYARVDSARGVWKAPANVGINGITGANIKLTDADQNFMNIDPTSGKSVNAIRSITGRGTVVWGARTLMGNSNEWRYINVRRYFNYVEESVKKATYQFVFEPNDANTWVKVRAMIENFLTNQWRDGALQGAKPEQAFTVRIGLGQTMTPQDVLEGKMIVEIGMAVVRPAEFIYLRFSHKMPEA